MTDIPWHPGQRAAIGRQTVVTIDRVTPAGRAIVGTRTFERDGNERRSGDPYRRAKLEPLTPEIEAEMALVERGNNARRDASGGLDAAGEWLRGTFGGLRRSVPDAADVEKAERLAEAIRGVMDATQEKANG